MSPARNANLGVFTRGLQVATKFGVANQYRTRFRRLRKEGCPEQAAADQALRGAIESAGEDVQRRARAQLGVTLVMKEGKA